jgi:uncharacterized protein (TIGR02118 family)
MAVMSIAKLIVAYPQPLDTDAFEKLYLEEPAPLAIAKLDGKTRIVATTVLASAQGTPQFYCVAEIHFPSMTVLEECAASAGGRETLANAVKISSGGPPVIMIGVDKSFTF